LPCSPALGVTLCVKRANDATTVQFFVAGSVVKMSP
jgi:hypothetical protein